MRVLVKDRKLLSIKRRNKPMQIGMTRQEVQRALTQHLKGIMGEQIDLKVTGIEFSNTRLEDAPMVMFNTVLATNDSEEDLVAETLFREEEEPDEDPITDTVNVEPVKQDIAPEPEPETDSKPVPEPVVTEPEPKQEEPKEVATEAPKPSGTPVLDFK